MTITSNSTAPEGFTPADDLALYLGPTAGMVEAVWTEPDGAGDLIDTADRLRDDLAAVLERLGR